MVNIPNDEAEFVKLIYSEDSAIDYIKAVLYDNGNPKCPYCKCICGVYQLGVNSNFQLKCKNNKCYKKFHVFTGSAIHGTKLPLRKWLYILFLVSKAKYIKQPELMAKANITQKIVSKRLNLIMRTLMDLNEEEKTFYNLIKIFIGS